MIPVLYSESENTFTHNGMGLLVDVISCDVTQVRNGEYELELTYPVGGFIFDEIKRKRIIKAKANNRKPLQLFRIYYISKPLMGKIKVKAEHITYDARKNFIVQCNYSGNCIGALTALKSACAYACKFQFLSDITMSSEFKAERKNLLNAIVGSEGSIIDTYGNGADIVRDNLNIGIMTDGGNKTGVLIAFRRNMTGFTCEEDDTDVITQIYPYAINDDNIITISEQYIFSDYINNNPEPIIAPVEFKDVKTEKELRQASSGYFNSTKKDLPKFTYKIEFQPLEDTINYKDVFGEAELIDLCDTVIIKHEVYGISTEAKVIKQVYDSLKEKNKKLELGQPKTTLKSIIDTTVKDSVSTIKALNNTSGNDGGYIRLSPSEILILDDENLNQAQNVWRWNKNGLAASTNGYNGNYVELAKNGKLVINKDTVDLNLTAPAGQASYEYNYEHNLGYVPAFLGFQVDTLSGGNTQLPVIDLDDSMVVNKMIKADADSEYIKISVKRNANNTMSAFSFKIKLFIYKEALI